MATSASRTWAEAARSGCDSTRSAAAASTATVAPNVAPHASHTERTRTSTPRLPVGLRPVTQQQLEARRIHRAATAPSMFSDTARTFNSSSHNNSNNISSTHRAPSDDTSDTSDDDTGGWTSVESKSRWSRTHKQRTQTATRDPSRRTASSPSSAYHYAWATTAVTSGAATAIAIATTTSHRVITSAASSSSTSQRDDTTRQQQRSTFYRHESSNASMRPPRSSSSHSHSMRQLPITSSSTTTTATFRRSTSLQQLLTQMEATHFPQHVAFLSSSSPLPVPSFTCPQPPPLPPVALVQAPPVALIQAPAVQKCGDKRDFFFRNLDFDVRKQLQIDDVAGFSVTEHEMATKISETIVQLFANDVASEDDVLVDAAHNESRDNGAVESPRVHRRLDLTITDATACIGGNALSFCDYFAVVNAVENDLGRLNMLQHNLRVLNKQNAVCIYANYLHVMHELQQDVVFLDPPWGGPEYKDRNSVQLFLDDVPLDAICRNLVGKTSVVVLKVPTNFDADTFATHVPRGRVRVKTDLNKMHLVIIDFRDDDTTTTLRHPERGENAEKEEEEATQDSSV